MKKIIIGSVIVGCMFWGGCISVANIAQIKSLKDRVTALENRLDSLETKIDSLSVILSRPEAN